MRLGCRNILSDAGVLERSMPTGRAESACAEGRECEHKCEGFGTRARLVRVGWDGIRRASESRTAAHLSKTLTKKRKSTAGSEMAEKPSPLARALPAGQISKSPTLSWSPDEVRPTGLRRDGAKKRSDSARAVTAINSSHVSRAVARRTHRLSGCRPSAALASAAASGPHRRVLRAPARVRDRFFCQAWTHLE